MFVLGLMLGFLLCSRSDVRDLQSLARFRRLRNVTLKGNALLEADGARCVHWVFQ